MSQIYNFSSATANFFASLQITSSHAEIISPPHENKQSHISHFNTALSRLHAILRQVHINITILMRK